MYASKTTELLKRVLWARNGQNRHVKVLKPAFDNRYAETEIVTHDGLKTTAESIITLPEIIWGSGFMTTRSGGLVVLDEVQFFMEPYVTGDVVDWVRGVLAAGNDIVAAGLDMDCHGKPFFVTANLAAMADDVIKSTANCTVCGRPAGKTHRIDPIVTADEPHVELGGTDKYEARCNVHWNTKGG